MSLDLFRAWELQKDVMDSLEKEFYTVSEVARTLNARDQVIYDKIRTGEIPSVEIGSGKNRHRAVPKKTLAKLLAPSPIDEVFQKIFRGRGNS